MDKDRGGGGEIKEASWIMMNTQDRWKDGQRSRWGREPLLSVLLVNGTQSYSLSIGENGMV